MTSGNTPPPGPPWLASLRRALARHVQAGAGPSWVVAVSGGGDSVALLRALHSAAPGLPLTVAHLDHGARGPAAAEADARFVADLADRLNLPFEIGHWRPTRPAHFEADARRARYAWLAELAARLGASAVAVGHTRDDQAETVLHRLLRGTGPAGLAGIPRRRRLAPGVDLIRPLLHVSRQELRAYLSGLGQTFLDDPTNADISRTRARLRHDLLPKLETEYNPAVSAALARLARQSAASWRALSRHLEALERAATRTEGDDGVILDLAALRRIPAAWRADVLRLAWRRRGWPEGPMTSARWRRLASAISGPSSRFSAGAGIEALSGAGLFVLRPTTPDPQAPILPPCPLPLPGSAPWPGGHVVATFDPSAPRDESLDADSLVPPLFIASPAPGDRFAPLGLNGQSQPLNDFFRGRSVPLADRPRVPLVRDATGIAWVVGHRIADRVRTTGETRRVLGLRWDEDGSASPLPTRTG